MAATVVTVLVMLIILLTVEANNWEIYNDGAGLSVEEIFVPVKGDWMTEPLSSTKAQKKITKEDSSKDAQHTHKQAFPTSNHDSAVHTHTAPSAPEVSPALKNKEISRTLPETSDVVTFSQSKNENVEKSTMKSSKNVRDNKTGKEIPDLKLVKSPEAIADLMVDLRDDNSEDNEVEMQQRHQQQHHSTAVKSGPGKNSQAHNRQNLLFDQGSKGVEEIFVDGRKATLPSSMSSGVDCPPGSDEWDCLLMEDDLLAMAKDTNLSGSMVAHSRVKRQSDGEVVEGSGDGNNFYPDTSTDAPVLSLDNELVFTDNSGDDPFDEDQFREELQSELERIYGNITGFVGVVINNVQENEDGTITTDVQVQINTGDPQFAELTNDEYVDELTIELGNANDVLTDQLAVDGRTIVNTTDPDYLVNQASSTLADPCSTSQCPLGFHECSVIGDPNDRVVQCTHKCETFETERNCEHGATCELDQDYEPFCACTKGWTGTYCETANTDKTLDEGEITGIALGGAAVLIGIIGTMCYLLACRRSGSDLIFTHYSDEEGSERYSNPSSKLSHFVIDRPRITLAPISTFNPTNSFSDHNLDISKA